jgi:hypothetical protein
MMFRIVPNVVSDDINKKLDEAYAKVPEAAVDREIHYYKLLDAFDDLGFVPDFTLVKDRKNEGTP